MRLSRAWFPAVVLLAVVLTGCVRITDERGNVVRVFGSEGGLAGVSSEVVVQEDVLRALVKGSIYGSGEFVTVFGTCLNATDGGFPGSYASMSSWYPNGSLFFENVSMGEMQTGYFFYTGNMSAVQGTYLTEMTCHVNGSDVVAKAFGEWQNPYWVAQVNAVNGTLYNLSVQLNESMEITWDKIDNISVQINTSYENLTTLIYYAAGVANGSVDRNDSYLAVLLQLIASTVGAPVTQNLTVVEDAEATVYFRNWNIDVTVYNEYNVTVGSPVVSCFINTTNNPPTTNQLMTWQESQSVFRHTEKVTTLPGVDFAWSTWCVYN